MKAVGAGWDAAGLPFGKREREHPRLVSFIGSISAAPVNSEPAEAPAAVSAVCSGPVRPGRGLGEGWSAGLTED